MPNASLSFLLMGRLGTRSILQHLGTLSDGGPTHQFFFQTLMDHFKHPGVSFLFA